MAFSSNDMENSWKASMLTTADTEWVDIVNTTNGDYLRYMLTSGTLKKWNKVAGTWDATVLPTSFQVVNPRTL